MSVFVHSRTIKFSRSTLRNRRGTEHFSPQFVSGWLWLAVEICCNVPWEARNKIQREREREQMQLCRSKAFSGERGVLCSLRNLSEGR